MAFWSVPANREHPLDRRPLAPVRYGLGAKSKPPAQLRDRCLRSLCCWSDGVHSRGALIQESFPPSRQKDRATKPWYQTPKKTNINPWNQPTTASKSWRVRMTNQSDPKPLFSGRKRQHTKDLRAKLQQGQLLRKPARYKLLCSAHAAIF